MAALGEIAMYVAPLRDGIRCPAQGLLLACLKGDVDSDQVERIRWFLNQDIDWSDLLELAARHGVIPLVYQALTAIASNDIPPSVLKTLRQRAHVLTYRNLILTRELLQVLTLFEANGIKTLPFKGPVLAQVAYGNLNLRTYADLDVLVYPGDVSRAIELLVSMGYNQPERVPGIPERDYEAIENHLACYRPDLGARVEVHWAITPRSCFYPDKLKDLEGNLDVTNIAGSEIRTMGIDDLLVILCVHGCKHRWDQLKWVCDTAELVRRNPQVGWESVLRKAEDRHVLRMFLIGMGVAERLVGVSLPEVVTSKIKADKVACQLIQRVCSDMFLDLEEGAKAKGEWTFHIQMRERWRDRLPYIAAVLLTVSETDRKFIRLPRFLNPLYYLVRPLRMLWQSSM